LNLGELCGLPGFPKQVQQYLVLVGEDGFFHGVPLATGPAHGKIRLGIVQNGL
jgi:hypothetical protein